MSESNTVLVTHDSKQGRGGWREVATEAELTAMDASYIRDGMIVAVTETNVVWYRKNNTWIKFIELDKSLSNRIIYLETELSKRLTFNEVKQLVSSMLEGLEPVDPTDPEDPDNPGNPGEPLFITDEDGTVSLMENGEQIEAE